MEVELYTSIMENIQALEVRIMSVGYAKLDEAWQGQNDWMRFNRLFLVKSGSGMLAIGEQEVRMQPGMAYLVPANVRLHYRCDSPIEKIYILFNIFCPTWFDLLDGQTQIGEIPIPEGLYPHLRSLVNSSSIADSFLVRQEFFTMLAKFIDKYKIKGIGASVHSQNIRNTVAYIHENLSISLRVEDLARQQLVSRNYLAEQFKKEVGMPISRYLDLQVMAKAQKMLQQPNVTIAKISQTLGFADQSYFTRWFKRRTCITPTQYRLHRN